MSVFQTVRLSGGGAPDRTRRATPPARDVEQRDVAESAGTAGSVIEVFANGLQPKHRAKQQQRRPGGPGLWAARGWILNRKSGVRAFVASECFG